MPKFYVEVFRDMRETTTVCVVGKDRDEALEKAKKYWKDWESGTVTHQADHDWDWVDHAIDHDSIEVYEEASQEDFPDIE